MLRLVTELSARATIRRSMCHRLHTGRIDDSIHYDFLMLEKECPISAVEKALQLASRVEVGDIPCEFDPGDLGWEEVVETVARRFSNHAALQEQLDDVLARARSALCEDCHFLRAHPDEDLAACDDRWLAEYRLWEMALEASERAYQRWLARQAVRRAAEQRG